jgi:putative aminopeptidase FrvX
MELLKQLYEVHSPSGKEEPMRKFIIAWAKAHDLKVQKDRTGNLYITKGAAQSYPCIVAHMDEVHYVRPDWFRIVVYKDNYILGGDAEVLRPAGIGADDKNGIWVALRLLEKFDAMKAAFFVQEEVGCKGSGAADMTFFDDCRFVLQADRKGGSDFINVAGGTELCNSKFIKDMHLGDYGYKCTQGLTTDVMTLKQRGLKVSCANISCGYYNPHTPDEYTSFAELENCLAFIEHAFATLTDSYPHKNIPKYGVNYQSSNMNNKYPFLHFNDGDLLVESEFNHYGGWPSKR